VRGDIHSVTIAVAVILFKRDFTIIVNCKWK